ncbi:MAG: hypothetical protein KJO43_11475, partial [Phycisphaerae bacterium]|nr:hypothetical protein [Phycisphaerae bacterium]
SGPQRFEAVFVPDDPAADAIDRNNTAMSVTFVGGEGKVLLVADDVGSTQFLAAALRASGITVELRSPTTLDGGLVALSGYDSVILVNTARWSFDQEQDRMLHAYVHDLGGGLVMIGGNQSFGAGGWIDSEVAKTLPVDLNPPATRQMPAGALALIMHSCEMAQGNFWGQQVAQAAIDALSRLDYVGIIEFNWGAQDGFQGCRWAFPMQRLGDKTAALDSTKTMQVGDMPTFAPSMQLALQGLMNTTAAQRHTIIISDGDPQPPSTQLLKEFADKKVTVTTVMVGGHGTPLDRGRMQAVAEKTGGQFYNVKNPKQLPQIFIKEARIVSRSLIQDGETFQPQVVSQLPGPTQGFGSVPTIDGYVLTAKREGLANTAMVVPTSDGRDPLLASWNYGLGRTIAYTSDVSSLWGAAWASWERFQAFWEQAIRWSMRPSTPSNLHVNTRFEGDQAIVELEATDADASSLNFLNTSAIVLRPDHEPVEVTLQQTGPGLYRGQFDTDEAGAYLINIGYESTDGTATAQGNIQAAVTVPYPGEFRTVKHNAALLEALARDTGGRVLAGGDPALADLFDRTALEVPRSMKRMWDLLAMIAAALLVLDVAARRLSIDPTEAAAAARSAVSRRAAVGAGTLDAWKRTKSQSAERADPLAARSRFDADASDVPAVDVAAETSGGPATAGTSPRVGGRPETDAGPPEGDDGDGDYTSRLLAAKRRARGNDGEGAPDA